MSSAKMTKQTRMMVEAANKYLRENHVKDQSNSMFITVTHLLLAAKCYHGFNFFTEEGYLSGGENEMFDHLEFFID